MNQNNFAIVISDEFKLLNNMNDDQAKTIAILNDEKEINVGKSITLNQQIYTVTDISITKRNPLTNEEPLFLINIKVK